MEIGVRGLTVVVAALSRYDLRTWFRNVTTVHDVLFSLDISKAHANYKLAYLRAHCSL